MIGSRSRIHALIVGAALFASTACSHTEEDLITLIIAPNTVTCYGVGVQQCMLVKERADDEWTYFYDGIEGFTYEPGFTYTLRVARRRIHNPPADGSSLVYRLLAIVSKIPASGSG